MDLGGWWWDVLGGGAKRLLLGQWPVPASGPRCDCQASAKPQAPTQEGLVSTALLRGPPRRIVTTIKRLSPLANASDRAEGSRGS